MCVCGTSRRGGATRRGWSCVMQAAQLWRPQTHALWPAGGRARAEELVRLGWLLSNTLWSPGPFGGEEQSLMDAWREYAMPHALVRAEWEA